MRIFLTCSCGHSLNVKDELAGGRIRCPKCGEVVRVPANEEDEETPILLEDLWEERNPQSPQSRREENEEEDAGPAKVKRTPRGGSRKNKTRRSKLSSKGQKALSSTLLGVAGLLIMGMWFFLSGFLENLIGVFSLLIVVPLFIVMITLLQHMGDSENNDDDNGDGLLRYQRESQDP